MIATFLRWAAALLTACVLSAMVAATPALAQTVTCSPASVSLTLNAGVYDPNSPSYISPTPNAQFQFQCSATPAGNYFYKLTITGSNPRQMTNPATGTPLAYQLCAQVSGNVCTVPWTSTSPISGGSVSLPNGNPTTLQINLYALLAPQQSVEPAGTAYSQVSTGIQLFLCRGSPCP